MTRLLPFLQEDAHGLDRRWRARGDVAGTSGVSGGIVTVSPGKGGLATYSPPLDAAGNSVRGQLATRYLADRLGLNLFASVPAEGSPSPF